MSAFVYDDACPTTTTKAQDPQELYTIVCGYIGPLLLLLLQRLMPHIYTTMADSIGGAEGVRAHFVHKG